DVSFEKLGDARLPSSAGVFVDHYPLLIAGRAPSKHRENLRLSSPYSGKSLGSFEQAEEEDVERALSNATRSFQQEMKRMPAYKRADILYRLARLVEEQHEVFAQRIALEGGKPLRDSRLEVSRAVNTIKMSGDEALQLNGETITMDRAPGSENCLAYTIRMPVGPVLAISAFNHPLNLICHQVCTAFAAGNTVIVKPASQTPLSCFALIELFYEAGASEEAISLVAVPGARAEQLVKDARIRFLNFIGGEDVGWELRRGVAPGVRVALEHGGTGTAIIAQDGDLERAVPALTRASFYHAGQVCVSTQRIFVHESQYEAAKSRFAKAASELQVGDPSDPDTEVGPLIRKEEVERVHRLVQSAADVGAEVLCGGKALERQCYAPTVLANTNGNMEVVSREVFGPVVALQSFRELEAVYEELNESPYSFQTALYTDNIDTAHAAARKIETRALLLNESTAFRVDWMPFGGGKRSGLGVGGTRHAVHEMSEERLVVVRVEGL
ncbi:aldehyde dehydrogenase family protein, partial [bacterium]|nr:aldehyde dehydrogenase family protein [bacterium]